MESLQSYVETLEDFGDFTQERMPAVFAQQQQYQQSTQAGIRDAYNHVVEEFTSRQSRLGNSQANEENLNDTYPVNVGNFFMDWIGTTQPASELQTSVALQDFSVNDMFENALVPAICGQVDFTLHNQNDLHAQINNGTGFDTQHFTHPADPAELVHTASFRNNHPIYHYQSGNLVRNARFTSVEAPVRSSA